VTATPTRQATRTGTITRTPTRTLTFTRTRTPTRTLTFTRTATGTRTSTPTPPNTPTITPTAIKPVVTVTINLDMQRPKALVVDRSTNTLFAVARDTNDVYVISLNTYATERRVPVGVAPFGAAFLNGIVYVANFDSGTVSRIDVATRTRILPDIAVGPQPTWIAVDHVSGRVFVVTHGDNGVVVLRGDSIWRIIPVGTGAFAIAVDPVGRRAYVSNRDQNTVSVINIDRDYTVSPLRLAGSPFGLTVNESNGKLYVLHGRLPLDCPAQWMAIFDRAGRLLSDIRVGNSCDGGWLAVNPANGRVYIAATADNEVWVVGPDDRVRSVLSVADGIGHAPFGLAIDPATARIFVANKDDGTISVISDPWP
jgi:YVTN family beta-propeller protein